MEMFRSVHLDYKLAGEILLRHFEQAANVLRLRLGIPREVTNRDYYQSQEKNIARINEIIVTRGRLLHHESFYLRYYAVPKDEFFILETSPRDKSVMEGFLNKLFTQIKNGI